MTTSTSPDPVRAFVPLPVPAGAGSSARREELEAERRAARAAGYAEGWARGCADAARRAAEEAERVALAARTAQDVREARLAAAVRHLEAAARDLELRAAPALEEVADTVLEAALRLAAAVVGHEVAAAAPGEAARDGLRRALSPLRPGRPVTVRLSPGDAAAVQVSGAHPAGPDAGAHAVRVVADPALQPGDAVAVQDGTTVDARLAAALQRAGEVLAR